MRFEMVYVQTYVCIHYVDIYSNVWCLYVSMSALFYKLAIYMYTEYCKSLQH